MTVSTRKANRPLIIAASQSNHGNIQSATPYQNLHNYIVSSQIPEILFLISSTSKR